MANKHVKVDGQGTIDDEKINAPLAWDLPTQPDEFVHMIKKTLGFPKDWWEIDENEVVNLVDEFMDLPVAEYMPSDLKKELSKRGLITPPEHAPLAHGDLVKSNDDKMQVFGWAYMIHAGDGEQIYDVSGEFISKDEAHELEDAAYDFVLHSRDGGDWHSRTGVGTMIESVVFNDEKIAALGLPEDTPRGWWVGFQVHDQEVWRLVKDGKYTSFSIHGTGVKEEFVPDVVAKAASVLDRYKKTKRDKR